MAWTAPTTRSTGDLVTASIWNTDLVNNLTALRTGSWAIASQAIGDLLYASSTTQFDRIAAVVTGQVLKSAGTGTAPAWGTIAVSFLSDGSNVALLNASNTFTAQTQTFSKDGNNVFVNFPTASSFGSLSFLENTVTKGTVQLIGSTFATSARRGFLELYGTSGISFWPDNATNLMSLSSGGVLTVNGFGAHAFSAGGTGSNVLLVRNTTNGGGNYAGLEVGNNLGTVGFLYAIPSTSTLGGIYTADSLTIGAQDAGGIALATTHASGTLRFLTNSLLRWGVNAAGDWTFGTSSHIADSVGTPSGGNYSAGTDYAFKGTCAGACSGTVTFGHTWSTAPICIFTHDGAANAIATTAVSTTTVTYGATGVTGASNYFALCRSY